MAAAQMARVCIGLAALTSTTACVTVNNALDNAAGSVVDSHVQGFASAYCLRALGDKGLPEPLAQVVREQGERWTEVVVQRSRGDIAAFFAMIPAIDSAIAATPMAQVKDETNAGSAPAPVYYCSEITRQPEVARAIAAARTALAPSYSDD